MVTNKERDERFFTFVCLTYIYLCGTNLLLTVVAAVSVYRIKMDRKQIGKEVINAINKT